LIRPSSGNSRVEHPGVHPSLHPGYVSSHPLAPAASPPADRMPGIGLSRRQTALLLGLFAALFCANLLVPRDLWVQDEARYGEVVREMLESGQWLVPHLNGHPYPDKPPLYFWIVAAVGSVVGQGELAFRLTTALSTLIALAGVGAIGRMIGGSEVGLWSAVLFATTFVTLVVGHIARMDMLLTMTAVFAWLVLEHLHRTHGAWTLATFWALAALGIAIKGPIALLFTVLPGVAAITVERGWQGLRELRPVAGLLTLAAMILTWAGLVVTQGNGDYLYDIWNRQLVGRAVDAWSHREPFYFYALLLPLLVMPWTGLAAHGFRVLFRDRAPARASILSYSLLPLLAISLVSGKLFIYVEPVVPALAIAAALGAAEIQSRPKIPRWVAWPPVLLLAVCVTAVIYVAHAYLSDAPQAYGVAVGLFALTLLAAALARSRPAKWVRGWVGVNVGVSWLVFGWLALLINPLFSPRALSRAVARHAAPAHDVGEVRTTRGILNYYAERLFTEVDPEHAASWWAEHPRAVLVIKTPDLKYVLEAGNMSRSCRVDETYSLELKEYHVLAGC
jgi:4-amino-4-deoxy-L-arabinose transferase-like glycosyltransferase